MSKQLEALLLENQKDVFRFLSKVAAHEKKLFVKGDLLEILECYKAESGEEHHAAISDLARKINEGVAIGSCIYFEFREKIGFSECYIFNLEELAFNQISAAQYLKAKETFIKPEQTEDLLTLNFRTFYDKFPSVRESKNIGHGVEYLNRYLSSNMFTNPAKLSAALFDFLFLHKIGTRQLVLNDRVNSPEKLSASIEKAKKFLQKQADNEPYENIKQVLQEFGLEPGLGNTAAKIMESLELLDTIMLSPDPQSLKAFLSRIPMIFNIAVISPHGYFGQEGVLGMPDTGGQVVYILDQVKALEQAMAESFLESGVTARPKIIILTRLIPNAGNTCCNQRLEKVHETRNTWILRVPFRQHNKRVTDNWISRFEIWPYLEEFALDACRELLTEFGQRPDLLIGNYSDGNLVASILSRKLGVTQCNIAHALEKSKYLFSALYWESMEEQYHFSSQFTVDLLAMNSANFIITSSYQEIAGTEESIGQYESYLNFTLPGLYRVTGGINLFHPKFNILPPGVNTKVYFPYTRKKERREKTCRELTRLLFENAEDPEVFGRLTEPDKVPIFSLARLDKIKNLSALVQWFGKSKELQEQANLIIVAGKVDPEHSTDGEEKEQIHLLHALIGTYDLQDKIRWIGKLFRKEQTGEVYRLIADRKGVFVQPALFEGFGLTVLEAMRSGLPVFATQYGGPLEIIQDGRSGFHIDPINEVETIDKLSGFLQKCAIDAGHWTRISKNAIERVDTTYNWGLYSRNLLSLAKIYGFWRFSTNIEMEEMNAYLDVLYHLLYLPMARKIMDMHMQR
ncbi:MAG: sucrose synthase [Thermodesulfobacteriota bacterium]